MPKGVGPDCDLCGETTDAWNGREWLGTARDPTGDSFFRHAVVCSDCWHHRVLPWLRWLFRGGPDNHHLNAPPGETPRDAADLMVPSCSGEALTVDGDGGKTHAVAEVRSGPPYGDREFCVAYCGFSGFRSPDPASVPLAGEDDPCRRCLDIGPLWATGDAEP